jgi:hypothetical protein
MVHFSPDPETAACNIAICANATGAGCSGVSADDRAASARLSNCKNIAIGRDNYTE